MKHRTRRQTAKLVVGALLLAVVLATFGLTRSTTTHKAARQISPLAQAPEAESPYGKADPDEYLDLKQSSAQPVSERRRSSAPRRRPRPSRRRPSGLAGSCSARTTSAGASSTWWPTSSAPDTLSTSRPRAAASGRAPTAARTGRRCGRTTTRRRWARSPRTPNGTLWAGTGEANPSGGGLTYFGDGIYKSTDGGAHWHEHGPARQRVDRPHRRSTRRTRTRCSRRRRARRRARSPSAASTAPTDGGQTWKLVLAPPNADDRRDRRRDRPRQPADASTRRCGTTSATTARASTAASAPACSAPTTAATPGRGCRTSSTRCRPTTRRKTGPHAGRDLGRIGVAIAPSNPNRIYVVTGSPYGPDKGFYGSDDGGDTLPRRRPRLPDVVAATSGGSAASGSTRRTRTTSSTPTSSLRTSTNGGTTWPTSARPALRPSRDGLTWRPRRQPGHADARLPRQRRRRLPLRRPTASTARGSNGAPTSRGTSRYHLAVSQQDSTRLVTGLQDNGSQPHLDGDRAAPDRPDARQVELRRRRRRPLERDRPDRPDLLLRVLPAVAAAPVSCRRPRTTRRPTTPDARRITNAGWPANQRWTTDTPIAIDPNNDADDLPRRHRCSAARSTAARAFTMISPGRRRRTACPARCRRTRTTSARSTRTSTRRSRRSRRPRRRRRSRRADDLRRHRHGPRVEDRPTRARTGRSCSGLADALGERDRRRPDRHATTSTWRSPATARATRRPTSTSPTTAARPGRTSRRTCRTGRSR